jgi:hypothetical protein
MNWTRLCSASAPRKIVRPTSNLRTNVELPYVWFSSGTPKKILPFYRADALTVLVSRLSTCDLSIPTVCMHAEKLWGHLPAGLFGYSHPLGGCPIFSRPAI